LNFVNGGVFPGRITLQFKNYFEIRTFSQTDMCVSMAVRIKKSQSTDNTEM